MAIRIEKDTMGEVEVPEGAYYGAQTQRAVNNFPISGLKPHPALVRATVRIKKCAAKANMATGRLEEEAGEAIVAFCTARADPPITSIAWSARARWRCAAMTPPASASWMRSTAPRPMR